MKFAYEIRANAFTESSYMALAINTCPEWGDIWFVGNRIGYQKYN